MDKDKAVLALKNLLQQNKKGVGGHEMGEIVLIKKYNEYGILLSIKGSEFCEDNIKPISVSPVEFKASPSNKNNTCVVLTIMKQEPGENYYGFRVRYVSSKELIKLVEPDKEFKTEKNLSDLERHCKEECFMLCSEECSLWKYSTSGKTRNPYI